MLRKSILFAIAASAALGLAALSPTSASAHGGHGGGGHMGGGHFGGGHWGGYNHWRVGYRRPVWYPRPVVYAAVRPVAVSSPAPCTCLSKEYTPEGSVVFKDRCTNEMAMNPPPAPPQQTGQLEPQQQPYAQQYVQPTPPNAQVAK
jgi:hypothetical protein